MDNVSKSRHRLGRGEYADDEMSVWEARCAFLDALFRLYPATYWTLFPDEPGEDAYRQWREKWNDDPRTMVEWWQKRWHLNAPWLADVAINTQRARLRYFINGQTHFMPSAAKVRSGWFVTPAPRTSMDFHGQAVTIPLNLLYWDPARETRKEARDSIIAALDAELDRIEADASLALNKIKSKPLEHFEWLVRFQVGNESKTQLAAAVGMSREAVLRAINDLAAFVGIEPRKYSGGRPKRRRARTVKPVQTRR